MDDDTQAITADIGELTFGEVEILSKPNMSMLEQIPILDKIIIGGVRHLKLKQIAEIRDAVKKAAEGLASPN